MKGKSKCKILKEIRAEIARANDIEWVTENCTYKGECRGSCPKCEAEVRKLERALEARRRLGKSVVLAGISAGLITSAVSCASQNNIGGTETMTDDVKITEEFLAGMLLPPDETETEEEMSEMGELPVTVPHLMGDYVMPEDTEESVFELLGDIAAFLADNFTRSEAVAYRAMEDLFIMGFSDLEYSDDTDFNIPAGELFDVVGECEDYGMYMISYGTQLFGIDKAGFELVAEKM